MEEFVHLINKNQKQMVELVVALLLQVATLLADRYSCLETLYIHCRSKVWDQYQDF